jgi:hypothetical protein
MLGVVLALQRKVRTLHPVLAVALGVGVSTGCLSEPDKLGASTRQPASEAASGEPLAELTCLEPTDTVTVTDAPIRTAAVAAGGRFLVLKLDQVAAIVIFDTVRGEITRTIELASDDFILGAGGDCALVYLGGARSLESWSLSDGSRVTARPNPFGTVVTDVVMGHDRGDVAAVKYSLGTEPLAPTETVIVRTRSLDALRDRQDNLVVLKGRSQRLEDVCHLRADASLGLLSEWATSQSPSGVGLFSLAGEAVTFRYEHRGLGWVRPGDDGLVYTGAGHVLSSDLRSLGAAKGWDLVPGVGGAFAVGIDALGHVGIFPSGETSPLVAAGCFPHPVHGLPLQSWKRGTSSQSGLDFDQRIVFDPARGHLLFIPKGDSRIVRRPLDVESKLRQSGIEYLVVSSFPKTRVKLGERWTYTIEVLTDMPPLHYSFASGPKGMTLSRNGELEWLAVAAEGSHKRVTVRIENGRTQTIHHSFDLYVEGPDDAPSHSR